MAEPIRVLVVEDDEGSLELAEFLLEEAGVEVLSARDAEAARRVASIERLDAVLMDINLPGADGSSLARELRALPGWERVPVVALTAAAMRGDRERFLAAGCTGYIAKPIEVSTFVGTVLSYLESPEEP